MLALPIRERIGRAKYIPEEQVKAAFDEMDAQLAAEMAELIQEEGLEDA